MLALARCAFFALVLLQPAWHGWLLPPRALSAGWAVAIALLPLLPPAIGLLRGRGSAPFWSGLLSLPYFCHGVAEAWANPPARVLAVVECALALAVVFAVGMHGLRLRRQRRSGL